MTDNAATNPPASAGDPPTLVYDGDCPLCNAYSRQLRLRQGSLRLINAREDATMRERLQQRGVDLDENMALWVGEQLFVGADAVHALALVSSRSDRFNRFNHWLFRNRTRARLLYPMLRAGRNLLLSVLGRRHINSSR